MISFTQAIILGLLQGVSELFPISSLGHTVIIPSLLGWQIDQSSNTFVEFLVVTHLATAIVLLGFFIKDWLLVVKGMWTSLKERVISKENAYGKLGWLIVIGTVPVGILGILFEQKLKNLFASPISASLFLIGNGVMLYVTEKMIEKRENKKINNQNENTDLRASKLSWMQSVRIGVAQCLALLPGFSRTGATLAGGLVENLDHQTAARFSFLLATPVIFAAAVLKIPELMSSPSPHTTEPLIFGFIASGVAAYFAVKFLTNYFQTKTLKPFAWYCAIAGTISFVILLLK